MVKMLIIIIECVSLNGMPINLLGSGNMKEEEIEIRRDLEDGEKC